MAVWVQFNYPNKSQYCWYRVVVLNKQKRAKALFFNESLNEISKIEIIKCGFKGELSNGSHYIECKAMNENNFIEKFCSFEFNNKHAVCFKLNNASNNSWSNYLTNNLMIGGSILSVLTIIIAFIVLKSKKNKKLDSVENDEITQDSLE